jgi:hypothetical protein
MTAEPTTPLCPHCGHPLRPFQLPENSGWDGQIHFACFDDDCGYFRRGWSWMFDNYGVRASYRYRIDPVSGTESPLPVWSKDAIKDRILDAEVIGGSPDDRLSGEGKVRTRTATGKGRAAAGRASTARRKKPAPKKGTTS